VVSRFAPVLYMPVPLACLFALIAAGCIGYQYYTTFLCGEEKKEASLISLKVEDIPSNGAKDQEAESLEEIFKQAKRNTELAR
jgi:predicted negative regulator of RcsB-dependent stress response